MLNKKILIITRDFPPYNKHVGWMVRMASLANFLAEKGFEVFVLARRTKEKFPGLLKIDERVNVIYLNDRLNGGYSFRPFGRIINLFKKKLFNRYPIDKQHFLISRYYKKACRLIKKHEIKNVLISSPPSSLRILTIQLRKNFGDRINLIGDYRDPWTLRNMYIKNLSPEELKRRRELEQESLMADDYTSFVVSGSETLFREYFNLNKVLIVENGFVENEPHETKALDDVKKFLESNKNNLHFVFSGSGSYGIDGHKDIKIFLDSIDPSMNVDIILIGNIKGLKNANLSIPYFTINYVSNYEAVEIIKLCDVGLMIHHSELEAPTQFGGKAYDYINADIPPFFIVPQNASSIKSFMKRFNTGFCADVSKKSEISNCLNEIYKQYKSGELKSNILDENEKEEFRRYNQYKKFLDILI